MKALILTVGTATKGNDDIVEVLAQDIQDLNPAYVTFVVTDLSRPNAAKIINKLRLREDNYELIPLSSPHNLDEIFRKVSEAIRRLRTRGFTNENISINYTSGTKVMSSGAVLSAVFNACESLRYIFAGSATEDKQVVLTSPRAVFASQDMRLSLTLIQDMQFMSASRVLENMDRSLLSDKESKLATALHLIAEAYNFWDNFHYPQFLDSYKKIQFEHQELHGFRLKDTNLRLIREIARRVKRHEFVPPLFVDIYNNAVRRWISGRYDDAVSRIYRATEMLAQWVLARDFGVCTDDLDTRKVPPKFRDNFNSLRSKEDGKVKIGLRKAYELLYLLGSDLGRSFQEDEQMYQLFAQRNRSVLAHGSKAFDHQRCQDFLVWAKALMSQEIADFTQLCRQLQFPWLPISTSCSDVSVNRIDHSRPK